MTWSFARLYTPRQQLYLASKPLIPVSSQPRPFSRAMQASANDAKGKGKTVYVGGLAEDMNQTSLYNAFSPFGDIVDVQIPHDPTKRDEEAAHRGFGFVEFASANDAADAVDNMHMNRLAGRVLKVNLARPLRGQQQLGTNRAVWEDEAWLAEHTKGGPGEATMDEA